MQNPSFQPDQPNNGDHMFKPRYRPSGTLKEALERLRANPVVQQAMQRAAGRSATPKAPTTPPERPHSEAKDQPEVVFGKDERGRPCWIKVEED